jgi:hypothetical protein
MLFKQGVCLILFVRFDKNGTDVFSQHIVFLS